MHPVKKAISELHFRIPKQLLQAVFVDGSSFGRSNWRGNIDEQILALVVRPRVLVDCNLIGGIQQIIPLQGLAFYTPPDYQWATIVHIPKDLTFQKSINSVLDIVYFNVAQMNSVAGSALMGPGSVASTFSPGASDNSAMTATMAGVMAAMDKIPYMSTSRVRLIGENTIMISDGAIVPQNSFLRCVLENDENLTNIQLRSYRYFADLVEYAVKSFIYNELIVQMDQGQLMYGQTLGVFKDIVNSYADAEVNYRDYLKQTWEKVAFQNDQESHSRFIKLLVGGYR